MTRSRFTAAVAVGLVVAATPARAGLTLMMEATEVMMESQGLQAVIVGLGAGSDDASPLLFTSRVDADATTGAASFSYTLASGSTYRGQSSHWVTTGTRDSSGLWTWQTDASVGGFDLTGAGTMGPFVGVDPPATYDLFDPFRRLTTISDVTYTEKKGKMLSSGTITVDDPILGNSKTTSTDELIIDPKDKNKGKWKWATGVITDKFKNKEVKVVAFGDSPLPDGGAGTFTTTIAAVPEPSTGLLALSGLLGAGVWRRVRRARAGAVRG